MKRAFAVLLPILLSAFGTRPAVGEDFYANKTIKIITGGTPGGEFDSHARMLANYLGKYIPGNPTIVVENVPAASGLAAANYVFNVAKKDGTEIGGFTSNSVAMPMLGNDLAKFAPDKFNWIGTPGSYRDNAYLVFVRSTLPYKTFDDLRKVATPAVFGDKGQTLFLPLTKEVLGANIKIVEGYQGAEVNLALQRGEIDGMAVAYNNLKRITPDWLPSGFIRIVAQYAHNYRIKEFPDVPTGRELVRSRDDLDLVKFCELSLMLGYPFAAPPGVAPEKVAILRAAFDKTMEDAEYRAAMEKAGLEYSPKNGRDLAADIAEGSKVSPAIIARYKQLAAAALGGG